MSLEILQNIEQAEAKAEAIRADAQREAREMLKSIEDVCVSNERQAAMEHRAMIQRILEEARLTTNRRNKEMEKKEAGEREAVAASARKKLDDAARMIFERVVQDGHR